MKSRVLQGLTIVAKDYTAGYKGYRISFGTAKPVGGKFFAAGYKVQLHGPRVHGGLGVRAGRNGATEREGTWDVVVPQSS